MEKNDLKKALEELKKNPQRKFVQSYDLIINLKAVDLKQTPIDFAVTLPFTNGKKIKVGAFVAQELEEQAKKFCDVVIKDTTFDQFKDKKVAKKLAEEYDFFIAQANIMAKVAAAVGRFLGPKGKMPNPKMGCVVPPNANLEPLIKKLRTTVKLSAKKGINLQCLIGKENQPDEEIIENVMTVYNATLKQMPNETQNIKNVTLKLTMSKPVKV